MVHGSFLATRLTSLNSSFSSAKRPEIYLHHVTVEGGGHTYSANCKQLCASVKDYLCALLEAVRSEGRSHALLDVQEP